MTTPVFESKWRVTYEQQGAWSVTQHSIMFHAEEAAKAYADNIDHWSSTRNFIGARRLLGVSKVMCLTLGEQSYDLGDAIVIH